MELETQLIKGDQMIEIWSTFRRGKPTWVNRQYTGAQLIDEATTVSYPKVQGFIKHLEGMGFKKGAGGIT